MELKAAPDWIEALAIKYGASRAQILSAKLTKDIAQAEHKLEILIKKVAKLLAPRSVTQSDVRTLIENKLSAHCTKHV